MLHILINKSEYERAEKVHDDWLFAGPVFVIINLHMQLDLDHVTWILMFPTVQGTLRVVNHLLVTESWYNTNDFFF